MNVNKISNNNANVLIISSSFTPLHFSSLLLCRRSTRNMLMPPTSHVPFASPILHSSHGSLCSCNCSAHLGIAICIKVEYLQHTTICEHNIRSGDGGGGKRYSLRVSFPRCFHSFPFLLYLRHSASIHGALRAAPAPTPAADNADGFHLGNHVRCSFLPPTDNASFTGI